MILIAFFLALLKAAFEYIPENLFFWWLSFLSVVRSQNFLAGTTYILVRPLRGFLSWQYIDATNNPNELSLSH